MPPVPVPAPPVRYAHMDLDAYGLWPVPIWTSTLMAIWTSTHMAYGLYMDPYTRVCGPCLGVSSSRVCMTDD